MSSTIASRNRTETVASILEVCKRPRNKTEIMGFSYLAFEQASEYLDDLTLKEFLIFDPYKQNYKIASKGYKFLILYNKQEK